MPSFADAVADVLEHEGGYTNDSADPGGETNFGLSKRAYPHLDIRHLTREQAIALYRRDYWERCGCDALPPSIADEVFDAAVNSGPGNAARWLQSAAGVAPDGHIGPVTRAALAAIPPASLLALFEAERLLFLTRLTTWGAFGKGWVRRVAEELRDGVRELRGTA